MSNVCFILVIAFNRVSGLSLSVFHTMISPSKLPVARKLGVQNAVLMMSSWKEVQCNIVMNL